MAILRVCPQCGAIGCEHHQQRNGSTRQWRRIRSMVLNRDGHRCAECDETADLEIHHRDGNPANNVLTNLVTLCNYHHLEAEGRRSAATNGAG